MATIQQIKFKIEKDKLVVFSCYDFLSLGNYKSVCKSLERLVNQQCIIRLVEGLFAACRQNKILGIIEPVSSEDIVEALARKYQWKIAPAGPMALNRLGLSQQVPNLLTYVSTGPYKKVKIANYSIEFRHSYGKDLITCSPLTVSLGQALRVLGPERCDETLLRTVFERLPPQSRSQVIKEAGYLPLWMSRLILGASKVKAQ